MALDDLTAHVAEVLPSIASAERRDDLARTVLTSQRAHMPALRAFLSDVPPDAPWWQQAVPTALFKRRRLYWGEDHTVRVEFASSGTSDPNRRSRAAYSEAGLRLMDQAIELAAARMLFPEGRATRLLVMAPSPTQAPEMIMAYGMAQLIARFGLEGSRFLMGPDGLDTTGLIEALRRAEADGTPVTLCGASFGFVHLLDALQAQSRRFHLPEGSRSLDAGGFKGRSRAVDKGDLHDAISERFGIARTHTVNLLGMTELSTQLYDDTFAAKMEARPTVPGKVNPPWTATVAVDPTTLEPVDEGILGLLVHLDLANVERPACIRTQDVGRIITGEEGAGFEIYGRVAGSESRGCSLSIEELLQ